MNERIFGFKSDTFKTGIGRLWWNCPKCGKGNLLFRRDGEDMDARCCIHYAGMSDKGDWPLCDPNKKSPKRTSANKFNKRTGLTDAEQEAGQLTLFGETK